MRKRAAAVILAQRVAEAEASLRERRDPFAELRKDLKSLDKTFDSLRPERRADQFSCVRRKALFDPISVMELLRAVADAVKAGPSPEEYPPLNLPESAYLGLASGLSMSFWAALAQHEDSVRFHERIKYLRDLADCGRKFLMQLGIDPSQNGSYSNWMGSGIGLDLLRASDEEVLTSAINGARAITATAAELSKDKPGPRWNVFARRLLDELALQFHRGFGHWPRLKRKRERERDPNSPAAIWLRNVLLHVDSQTRVVRNETILRTNDRTRQALNEQVGVIIKWKEETLIRYFEQAITRVRPSKLADH